MSSKTMRKQVSDVLSYFDNWAVKKITKTDIGKGAIVPLVKQREVLRQCRLNPETSAQAVYTIRQGRTIEGQQLEFTYYNALRTPPRKPEPRLGRQGLLNLVEIGDLFYVCADGGSPIFFSVKPEWRQSDIAINETAETAALLKSINNLYQRASNAKEKVAQKSQASNSFIRNPDVVAFVKKAAGFVCQQPECTRELFLDDAGRNFVEVHHIDPLASGGLDVIENCACLCASCHREIHFGKDRKQRSASLREKMRVIHKEWAEEYK